MKVLHIGDNVKHGHRFNGHYISQLLNSTGIDSHHLVWDQNWDVEKTSEIKSKSKSFRSIQNYAIGLNKYYGTNGLFFPFSYDLLFDDFFLDCDIVHLHLIHNNFFGIEFLPILSKLKPIIWTFHDPWPLTGHCVHFFSCERWQIGCGDCKHLDSHFKVDFDSTALNWEVKKQIFENSSLNLISTSEWMTSNLKKSPFFDKTPIFEIPFGLDLNVFKCQANLEFRKHYKIPPEDVIIGFRSTVGTFKGLELLTELVDKLSDFRGISIVTFQEKGLLDKYKNKLNIIDLGWIEDDIQISEIYNSIDIFIMPSYAETFGMMAIEVMACGRALIIMRGTALEFITKPQISDVVCFEYGNSNELFEKTIHLINNPELRESIGRKSRLVVEQFYSENNYLSEIVSAYNKVISNHVSLPNIDYIIKQQKAIIASRGS